ncbi:MAG: 16S rRNA processing protein RimM [Deltaproteobacteria bacterium]|nr:MAG: 16S rRNA processing protein RimM [Deltaproteobacteria bacterium]
MNVTYHFPKDRYILIGTVIKASGIAGEVVVFPLSRQPENFRDYPEMVLVDQSGELSPRLHVESIRLRRDQVIIKFDRVGERSFAEKLVGMGVLLAQEHLPTIADGEYYWRDIVGKKVVSVDKQYLGTVQRLFSNGAQDVLVVVAEDREYLIPVVAAIVKDMDGEEIVVDPSPSLLNINMAENNTSH